MEWWPITAKIARVAKKLQSLLEFLSAQIKELRPHAERAMELAVEAENPEEIKAAPSFRIVPKN